MFYPRKDIVTPFVGQIREIYPNGKVKKSSYTAKIVSVSRRDFNRNGRWIDGWHQPTSFSNTFTSASQPKGFVREELTLPSRVRISSAAPYDTVGDYLSRSRLFAFGHVVQDDNLLSRAETEALVKIHDGNINLAVFTAELKETLGGIAANSVALMQAYRAARRGNWRRCCSWLAVAKPEFKRPSHDFGGRWLELQFGWLPLMSDIHDMYSSLKQKVEVDLPLRAQRTVGTRFSYTEPGYLGSPDLNCVCTHSVKVVLWYKITDARLFNAARLGLLNPLVVAWETVPYSFVVDWLFPVGNVLEAATSTLATEFLSGTRTFYGEEKASIDAKDTGEDGFVSERSQSFTTKGYWRESYSSFPVPSVYVKSPWSIRHALDAIALLNQLRK